jgi:hypothetical protein
MMYLFKRSFEACTNLNQRLEFYKAPILQKQAQLFSEAPMSANIAYYRARSDRQGASGLGLDAQRAAVPRHLGCHGRLVNGYTEIENGRRHTNRPQMLAALEECHMPRAVLLIDAERT